MKYTLIIIAILVMFSCDWPFNTTKTEDDIFELVVSHDIQRVMPSAKVILTWSEITVEDFKEIIIERMLETDTAWTSVTKLTDGFLTSYIDTIEDDEDLLYRVGITDIYGDVIWANGSTSIPPTTNVFVPTEFSTIQPAFNSKLVDDGDIITVNSGIYIETLGIGGKDVLIQSVDGYKNTILQPTFIEDPNMTERVLFITSGVLDGFTIELGLPSHAQHGGGVAIAQNATVENCYITGNQSFGYGGGVFITEYGNLYNCIITGDTADVGTGIFISNAHGEIINNTITNNSLKGDDVVIDGNCEGLIFRNNIVIDPNSISDIRFIDQSDSVGVIIDYLLLDNDIGFGTNIIISDPLFVDKIDYELSANSPAIDAGHPGNQYFDVDGTRNDIGSYGGPRNR